MASSQIGRINYIYYSCLEKKYPRMQTETLKPIQNRKDKPLAMKVAPQRKYQHNQKWRKVGPRSQGHLRDLSQAHSSLSTLTRHRKIRSSEVQRQQRLRHQPIIVSTVPRLPSYEFPSEENQHLIQETSPFWKSNTALGIAAIIILAVFSGEMILLNLISVILLVRSAVILGNWLDFIIKSLRWFTRSFAVDE